LALLCGALAWLEAEKARNEEIRREIRKNLEAELAKLDVIESPYFAQEAAAPKPIINSGCGSCPGSCETEATSIKESMASTSSTLPKAADDRDFQQRPGQHIGAKAATVLQYEDDTSKTTIPKSSLKETPNLRESTSQLPKIFFGSRT
jgi:hypothetical protein